MPETSRGGRVKPGAVLIVAAAVGLAALGVWASWRGAQRGVGEQDFDVTLICPQCGYTLETSFREMHTLPPPVSTRNRSSRTPITPCPHCRRADMFRAAPCPKCGKPALVDAVTVDGKQVGPCCFSCGWK